MQNWLLNNNESIFIAYIWEVFLWEAISNMPCEPTEKWSLSVVCPHEKCGERNRNEDRWGKMELSIQIIECLKPNEWIFFDKMMKNKLTMFCFDVLNLNR